MWIGCERGLYRVSRQELEQVAEGEEREIRRVRYDETDGLPNSRIKGQTSHPAGFKTRDGQLWFCTSQGVAVIDPRHLKDNRTHPPLVIEQIRANNQLVFDNALAAPLQSPRYKSASMVHLAPGGAAVIEIHYTANSFQAPEKVRFKYRLWGLDKDWHDAGSKRVAYYTNLGPRSYRFEVRAANNHGVWNETPASFEFSVLPHYYERTSFRVTFAGAIVLMGIGFYRWRVRELRRIQQLVAEHTLARERQRIADDLHHELGAGLTQISLLTELVRQVDPTSRGPNGHIDQIGVSARELSQSLGDIVWAVSPKHARLDDLISFVRGFAESLLHRANIRVHWALPTCLPSVALSSSIRYDILLIAKEAMNNIVKHAGATEVNIIIEVREKTLALAIADNGLGFELSADGMGNGLSGMRRRAHELGGRFNCRTQLGKGTQILIEVPITESALRVAPGHQDRAWDKFHP